MASLAYAWRNILSDDPTSTHDFKLLESQGGCVGNLNTANLEGEVHEDGDMFEKFAYILGKIKYSLVCFHVFCC